MINLTACPPGYRERGGRMIFIHASKIKYIRFNIQDQLFKHLILIQDLHSSKKLFLFFLRISIRAGNWELVQCITIER